MDSGSHGTTGFGLGVDVLTYAILSNHLHIVIRNRPDIVKSWSDRDVAMKWLRIFPVVESMNNWPTLPTTMSKDWLKIQNASRSFAPTLGPFLVYESLVRTHSSHGQPPRRSHGHFWEGRFKAIAITDEAALLACSVYVDLNPIRAALAQTPEQAIHTSAYDRLHALKGATISSAAAELITLEELQLKKPPKTRSPKVLKQIAPPTTQPHRIRTLRTNPLDRARHRIPRGNLHRPLLRQRSVAGSDCEGCLVGSTEMDAKAVGDALPSKLGFRASDQGFLAMPLQEYLELLDWTGRQKGHWTSNDT